MNNKITLLEWFDAQKIKGQRSQRKLQRWVREGRIQPMPEKFGREYLVKPTANLVKLKKVNATLEIIEQAKSDAVKMMLLGRESLLSKLLADIK